LPEAEESAQPTGSESMTLNQELEMEVAAQTPSATQTNAQKKRRKKKKQQNAASVIESKEPEETEEQREEVLAGVTNAELHAAPVHSTAPAPLIVAVEATSLYDEELIDISALSDRRHPMASSCLIYFARYINPF